MPAAAPRSASSSESCRVTSTMPRSVPFPPAGAAQTPRFVSVRAMTPATAPTPPSLSRPSGEGAVRRAQCSAAVPGRGPTLPAPAATTTRADRRCGATALARRPRRRLRCGSPRPARSVRSCPAVRGGRRGGPPTRRAPPRRGSRPARIRPAPVVLEEEPHALRESLPAVPNISRYSEKLVTRTGWPSGPPPVAPTNAAVDVSTAGSQELDPVSVHRDQRESRADGTLAFSASVRFLKTGSSFFERG